MTKYAPEILILSIFVSSASLLLLINKAVYSPELLQNVAPEYSWLIDGFINLLCYSTILIPGYLVYKYIKKINYLDKAVGNNCIVTLIQKCFQEDESLDRTVSATQTASQRTECNTAIRLLFYFVCLQLSLVSWGVLQEKVTHEYVNEKKEVGVFKDSQFLVFINRILAFTISGIVMCLRRQPRHKCPMYKYVFCSLSNILSSWCQYEALKYVSFLHQVLAKAAKTIPVMIMGRIVSRTKYEKYEYITACVLSAGMLFFMWDTGNDKDTSTSITTFSGAILLCSYIAFDSFTTNWQGALYTQYSMTPIQMMCAVNLFSCCFTAVSLFQQGSFIHSLNFMIKFPRFIVDCVLLSICSAVGQLFIYSTIADFGPLVFAIISTIRQGFSVIMSCILFEHEVHSLGIFGLFLVFLSLFFRIYCSHRSKVLRKRARINNESIKH
ncbi:PREDICTED: adenosine 3'-phospho 5'-phosphosulfate transporter 1-like [Nicrophorus vespilloides]|uniref:Adenosine 3'-phospho 5'-phosphosulfate transporter 1 n=1 Tax=Nicrophorus vespilloides TaxID=110193 RepID=A0ABM1MNI7_NICVS|nr:PREDICTED: adenosine 3'-phospho 5'-phosphosulfate transporter 1-like [Nicrophorus vespilloides]